MVQNEPSSGHFEMPQAAIDLGKSEIILPPRRIALALNVLAEQRQSNSESLMSGSLQPAGPRARII